MAQLNKLGAAMEALKVQNRDLETENMQLRRLVGYFPRNLNAFSDIKSLTEQQSRKAAGSESSLLSKYARQALLCTSTLG